MAVLGMAAARLRRLEAAEAAQQADGPQQDGPGALQRWQGATGLLRPVGLQSQADAPPPGRLAAWRQSRAAAAEGALRSAEPGAAAAQHGAAPELPAWAARQEAAPAELPSGQAGAAQRALPPREAQPVDAARAARPLPCAAESPSARLRVSAPVTSRSFVRYFRSWKTPGRHCGCCRAGNAHAHAALRLPRASWSASSDR
jgi:hypothetical protein